MGEGLDGVLGDLQDEVVEDSHHCPSPGQQLEVGIPDSEGEKGVGGKQASKTSVSYAVPILTNFTGYTAFSLRRIEDWSGNTVFLLVQYGGCSWCLPK